MRTNRKREPSIQNTLIHVAAASLAPTDNFSRVKQDDCLWHETMASRHERPQQIDLLSLLLREFEVRAQISQLFGTQKQLADDSDN